MSSPKGRLILPRSRPLRSIGYHLPGHRGPRIRSFPKPWRIEGLSLSGYHRLSHLWEVAQKWRSNSTDLLLHPVRPVQGRIYPLLVGRSPDRKQLQTGDHLICEACTYLPQYRGHRPGEDPRPAKRRSTAPLHFTWAVGQDFSDLSPYQISRPLWRLYVTAKLRLKTSAEGGIPVVNYGVLLASSSGILERALEP